MTSKSDEETPKLVTEASKYGSMSKSDARQQARSSINARVSISYNKLPLIEEAMRLWAIANWVYIFADIRTLTLLGRTKLPFRLLELESDRLTQSDVIEGIKHKENCANSGGKSGSDILLHILRMLGHTGLPRKLKKRKFKHFKSVAKTIMNANMFSNMMMETTQRSGDHENNEIDEILGDPKVRSGIDTNTVQRELAFIEELFSKSLIKTVPKKEACCKEHHGRLCSKMGFHYIQCFFDQVYEGAREEAESDDHIFRNFMDLMQGKNDTQDLSQEEKADMLYEVIFELFKEDSQVSNMAGAAQENASRVVWMNDRMGHQECVYLILVSTFSRQITVVFRGTDNLSDVGKDFNFSEYSMPNPIEEDYPGKPEEIELHGGFSEYLFHPRLDTDKSKYNEIAEKTLEYGREFGDEGFTLCVSGHSLGGALAAMFGFMASTDKRFTQKTAVRVFSFASPIPGKISYSKAFQHQEYEGKLMHARFAVEGDMIPFARFALSRQFAHGGYYIELPQAVGKEGAIFKYLHDKSWWYTWEANLITRITCNLPFASLAAHSLTSYPPYMLKALMRTKGSKYEGLSLRQHYEKFIIPNRGKIVDDGPETVGTSFRLFYYGVWYHSWRFLLFSVTALVMIAYKLGILGRY